MDSATPTLCPQHTCEIRNCHNVKKWRGLEAERLGGENTSLPSPPRLTLVPSPESAGLHVGTQMPAAPKILGNFMTFLVRRPRFTPMTRISNIQTLSSVGKAGGWGRAWTRVCAHGRRNFWKALQDLGSLAPQF